MEFTKLLFSQSIEFKFENDYKKVIATEDIPKGRLLLVEHVMCASHPILQQWLKIDKKSRDQLYPRNLTCDLDKQIDQKIFRNRFSEIDDLHVIGIYKSWFNSSKHFNAGAFTTTWDSNNMKNLLTDLSFGGVFSLHDIKKGDEVYIYYEHTSDKNEELMNSYLDQCILMFNNLQKGYIHPIIKNYLQTDHAEIIYHNQVNLQFKNESYWGNILKILSCHIPTLETGRFSLLDEYNNKLVDYELFNGKHCGNFIIYKYNGSIDIFHSYN